MRTPPDLSEEPTRPEIHLPAEPPGPRLGRLLLSLTLGCAALGYLITFVPALLSPVMDLLALTVLGVLGIRGLLRLLWRPRR